MKEKTLLTKYGYEIDQGIKQWFIRREEEGFSFVKYGKCIFKGKKKKEKCIALQYRQDLEDETKALYLKYSLKEIEDIVKYAKTIKRW